MLKTEATVKEISKEVVDFLSRYIKIDRLILFGSYRFGNARQDSDFDMAVISEDLENMPVLKKIELFSKVSLAVDSRVELKGFSKTEFLNPGSGSMLAMIKKTGQVLK